ncbi:unnamed protein product, partial [Pylaiella littoralis]
MPPKRRAGTQAKGGGKGQVKSHSILSFFSSPRAPPAAAAAAVSSPAAAQASAPVASATLPPPPLPPPSNRDNGAAASDSCDLVDLTDERGNPGGGRRGAIDPHGVEGGAIDPTAGDSESRPAVASHTATVADARSSSSRRTSLLGDDASSTVSGPRTKGGAKGCSVGFVKASSLSCAR